MMEPKSTIFVGREMVKIQKDFMPQAVASFHETVTFCVTSDQTVDSCGTIGYDPELVIQNFLNIREHRRQNPQTFSPLVLVIDLNFHTLTQPTREQVIEIMTDKVNLANTHVWINVSFLSAGLAQLFKSVPQICGFQSDKQTSIAICGDDRLSQIKNSNNAYLIKRLTTNLDISELVFTNLNGIKSVVKQACTCSSRDLFSSGCQCGFFKNKTP